MTAAGDAALALVPIGHVRSPLTDRDLAPRQVDELLRAVDAPGLRIQVSNLEALDAPIVDLKPVLGPLEGR